MDELEAGETQLAAFDQGDSGADSEACPTLVAF